MFEIFYDRPVRVEKYDRGGGGPARNAAPDDTGPLGSQWPPQGSRTGCRRADSTPGRAGVCLPNPSTLTDGAMRWAADLGGSPLEGMCEGNPG